MLLLILIASCFRGLVISGLVQKVCIRLTCALIGYSVTYTVHEKLCIGSKESITVMNTNCEVIMILVSHSWTKEKYVV